MPNTRRRPRPSPSIANIIANSSSPRAPIQKWFVPPYPRYFVLISAKMWDLLIDYFLYRMECWLLRLLCQLLQPERNSSPSPKTKAFESLSLSYFTAIFFLLESTDFIISFYLYKKKKEFAEKSEESRSRTFTFCFSLPPEFFYFVKPILYCRYDIVFLFVILHLEL